VEECEETEEDGWTERRKFDRRWRSFGEAEPSIAVAEELDEVTVAEVRAEIGVDDVRRGRCSWASTGSLVLTPTSALQGSTPSSWLSREERLTD
jgi:hypothetical protein